MGLEFSPLVTYPVIDRLLGGSSQDLFIPAAGDDPDRGPSDAGRCSSGPIAALGQAWSGLRELEFRLEQMASSPQIVQIVPPNEVVVVIGFEIRFNNRAGTMSLCIPFKVIEPSWRSSASRAGPHRAAGRRWAVPERRSAGSSWRPRCQLTGRAGRDLDHGRRSGTPGGRGRHHDRQAETAGRSCWR